MTVSTSSIVRWLKRATFVIISAVVSIIALIVASTIYNLAMYGHESLRRADWKFASELLKLPRDRSHSWPKEFDGYEFVCIVRDYGNGRYAINTKHRMNVPEGEFKKGSANYRGIEHVWSVAFVNRNRNMRFFYIRQDDLELAAEEGCFPRQEYRFIIESADGKDVLTVYKSTPN